MAIKFKCPNCQKAYQVKDEMAGKKVICTACKKPMGVPAPVASPAVPHHEADALAAAALADAPPAPAEAASATITVECPNCIEQVTFPAEKAGKQAPCPNCKRIIRVPIPATGKKDWRTADARPTFAKVTPEADLQGVVSTAQMQVVDREALAEAGALRKREREPLPLRVKITRGVIAGSIVLLVGIGALIYRGIKVEDNRAGLVESALKLVRENSALPAGVRAETFRAAGEFVLAQPDGKAETAKGYLASARSALTTGKPEQPFEKPALLARIAVTQTKLIDPSRLRGGIRFDWPAGLQELRHTLAAFDDDPAQWEGTIVAVRELTRALGVQGARPDSPAAVDQVSRRFTGPGEKADALGAVGLELLDAGEAGQKKAKELAEQLKAEPESANQPRAVALLAATRVADPPASESPPSAVRVGAAEGLARRGDLDAARAVARKPGSPEDRFQAMVALAAVSSADSDLADAIKFFAEEFKSRDLPDWSLIRLARVCAESKSPDAAKNLNSALVGMRDLSPRSEAVRAWVQMELLRSPTMPDADAAVKAIQPENSLGHLLAWEVLSLRSPGSAQAAPEPAKPLTLVGRALGSVR